MGDVNREHIIAGIDAARSKIDAIEVDYKYHVQENGEVRKRLAEVHVQRALADGTMSKLEAERFRDVDVLDASETFSLFRAATNRFAYQSQVEGMCVDYNQGVMRALEKKHKSGSISLVAFDYAFKLVPKVESLLLLHRDQELRSLLSSPTCIVTVSTSGSRFKVELSENLEASQATLKSTLFLDPAKDFWPTEVILESEAVNPVTKDRGNYMASRTTIDSFLRSEGVYYPQKVVKTHYNYLPDKNGYVEKVGKVETILVDKLLVNDQARAKRFEVEFPPGTHYLDDRDGHTYIVGAEKGTGVVS